MARKPVKAGKQQNTLVTGKFSLTRETINAELGKARKSRTRGATAPAAMAGSVFGMDDERKYYTDFPKGSFEGEPHLVWIAPDIFRHEPNPGNPFRFTRKNGETIEPGLMFTDGGSIPRPLWFIKDLSPWSYAPAFLIHDWLFDLHHCGKTDKSFEEVRDIMMEGVRTLMETKVCPMDRLAFDTILMGVDSIVARKVWDNPGCHLP